MFYFTRRAARRLTRREAQRVEQFAFVVKLRSTITLGGLCALLVESASSCS